MTQLKIPNNAKLFNSAELIEAHYHNNKILQMSNGCFSVTSDTFKFTKDVFINHINEHKTVIENTTNVRFTTPNYIVKISPSFVKNISRFVNSKYTLWDNAHQYIIKNSNKVNSQFVNLSMIFQSHQYIKNDINIICITGFSLCVHDTIVHSYNMKPISIESLVKLTKSHVLLSRENIWWLPNWISKTLATKQQIELSKKIRYPKYLKDELKNREKQLLNEKIIVGLQEK